MFKTLKNAFKTPEVRRRILYTLLLIVIFRLGCFISVPGVDTFALEESMSNSTNSVTGIINTISGGAFSRLSVFSMSISPYITAQIVVQLLAMIIPSLEKLRKEGGEVAKRKMNKYTKILCIILSLIEGLGIYISYSKSGSSIFIDNSVFTAMLIFVGIISRLPGTLPKLWNLIASSTGFSTVGFVTVIGIIVGAILLVAGVVFVQDAERRVPVQYAKKVVGRKMYGGNNTHIPMKLAMAGVMPIIFASSFMTFPAMAIQIFGNSQIGSGSFWDKIYNFSIATSSSSVAVGYTIANALVYFLLIVGFTYFYTFATFNPAEVATQIKQNGGFIPGIRAGKPTTDYLTSILTKITLFGSVFLSVIAILPMLMRFTGLNLSFGGTSILIVVGVALETVTQLESLLVMRHYKGFLKK